MAFVAPVALLWIVRSSGPGRAALAGLVYGVAYFGALLYWILLFGELGYLALVLASAVFVAAFGALGPAVWRPEHPVRSTVGLAALWTLLEWVRGSFPLGGFAWGQLGSTQVDAPALPLASVTGVWGLSFLVVLVAGLLLVALERWGSEPARAVGALGAAAVLAVAPMAIPVPAPGGREVEVAAIQVDVSAVSHLGGATEDRAVASLNVDRHRTLAADPPDLVVWGEGSLDPGALADPVTLRSVSDVVAEAGAPTISGAVVDEPDGAQHTSVLVFDGDGGVVDRYDKTRLVPFGEYVPFRGVLERFVDAVNQIPVDRVPGAEVRPVAIAGLPPIGTPICYENSYPGINRSLVRDGAAFLVLTINNASYERTAASEQHLAMSRLRAVENGRWVVHAAISGISAVVDPDGNVVDRRELFEPAVMRHTIRASSRTTLYTRLGDWVPWASLVVTAGLLALPRRRSLVGGGAAPLPADPRVLVVLPTYDERETIDRVLEGLLTLPASLDVLVIDDGSPDGTGAAVRSRAEADDRIRLIERPRKSGLASAYVTGFRRGLDQGYDLLVEMDSDLSHDPGDLPRLLEAARRHDLVIGSRYVPGGSVTNWSRARMALSRSGNTYARWALGLQVRDATAGFRVYRRAALARLLETPIRSDGYGFQVELVLRAANLGLSVGEVPITFREREHGRSKISRRIVVEALWLVTKWGVRDRFGRRTRAG